jgi:phospholipid/cholesterol/gamma-HCH transport system substrate-binding protein
MNNRQSSIKVGLLTVLSLSVLITTVIWLRGRGLSAGQHFEVCFKDVDSLKEGATVQLMGIRVGFVESVVPIMLDKTHYVVKTAFSITDPAIKLDKGSIVSIEQSGLIGEKFIEITPPRAKTAELVLKAPLKSLKKGLPIKVQFDEGWVPVGYVQNTDVRSVLSLDGRQSYHYDIAYVINRPGYLPPEESHFQLTQDPTGTYFLQWIDPLSKLVHSPPQHAYFTVEEPLRLKTFLNQQLASAEALKKTNEKFNRLLSEDTIASLRETIKNSEKLTGEASSVIKRANSLLGKVSTDIDLLVNSAHQLTSSVTQVSNNVNSVIGDPAVRKNITDTVSSVEKTTRSLSKLLAEDKLDKIVADTQTTTDNLADISSYLKQTLHQSDFQSRFNHLTGTLNETLNKLNLILGSVEETEQNKAAIQTILSNTKQTSENLSTLSQRLNKRFLLFRLLF